MTPKKTFENFWLEGFLPDIIKELQALNREYPNGIYMYTEGYVDPAHTKKEFEARTDDA